VIDGLTATTREPGSAGTQLSQRCDNRGAPSLDTPAGSKVSAHQEGDMSTLTGRWTAAAATIAMVVGLTLSGCASSGDSMMKKDDSMMKKDDGMMKTDDKMMDKK
jgi:hypothetical protein